MSWMMLTNAEAPLRGCLHPLSFLLRGWVSGYGSDEH